MTLPWDVEQNAGNVLTEGVLAGSCDDIQSNEKVMVFFQYLNAVPADKDSLHVQH